MPDDLPVTIPQVRVCAPQIAAYLDYIRWLATSEASRGVVVNAAQLWAFFEDHVRSGVAPQDAAEDLGLPISPDW